MKLHQFLFWLITFICTTSFILNTFGTIRNYFDDAIIISTQHRFDKLVTFPSLTVCFQNKVSYYSSIDQRHFLLYENELLSYPALNRGHLIVPEINYRYAKCHTLNLNEAVKSSEKEEVKIIYESSVPFEAFIHEQGQQFELYDSSISFKIVLGQINRITH